LGKFQPQERAKSIENGDTRYFTGRPCKYGHIEERNTKSGECLACSRKRSKQVSEDRKKECPDHWKKIYARYADKKKAYAKAYREANPEKVKQTINRYREENKSLFTRLQMERQLKIKQARPSWLTEEDMHWINAIYQSSKLIKDEYGVETSVDHMIPIKGKNVCGLHVPWNLRVVTRSYNSKKLNKLEENLPVYQCKNTVMIHESALPWNLRS